MLLVPKTETLCLKWPGDLYAPGQLKAAELDITGTSDAARAIMLRQLYEDASLFTGAWHRIPLLEALATLPPSTLSLKVRVTDGLVWSDWSEPVELEKEW